MKKVIKIDEQGLFIEDVILKDDEEIPTDCIDIECPQGFYKPKWNGEMWIEGLTQEEIEVIKNIPKELTEIEQLRLEQAQANAELFEMMLMLTGGGL